MAGSGQREKKARRGAGAAAARSGWSGPLSLERWAPQGSVGVKGGGGTTSQSGGGEWGAGVGVKLVPDSPGTFKLRRPRSRCRETGDWASGIPQVEASGRQGSESPGPGVRHSSDRGGSHP